MRKILAATITAALLALTSCGVSEGTVTGKNYEEPYVTQEEIMEEECETETKYRGTGSKRTSYQDTDCETVGTGEFEDVEHPAVYEFELTDEDGDTGTVQVDAQTFENTEEGEFYSE